MDQIKKYAPLWGKWIPTECIGEGGFGSVYRVKDKNGIQKDCAVKRITLNYRQLNLSSPQTLSIDSFSELLFQTVRKSIREIELMDTLSAATNIVTIHNYEIFPKDDSIDILLHMELLTSLSHLMEIRSFDRSEIIRIGIDLCDALISCEKYQIIHRDMKPDNIFRDSEGHYKLGDFGLSRQITASASASLRGFGGTPLYMAPEALTWGQKVSHKTDQYALGIILYQLLNDGKTPFCKDMEDSYELEQSIHEKLSGIPLPPPANENGKLWEIIRKACELEEARRYPSAAEMKQDLQKLLTTSKTSVEFKFEDNTYKNTFSALQTIVNEKPIKVKAAPKTKSVLMKTDLTTTNLFRKFSKENLEEVVFLNSLSNAPANAKDLSEKQDQSVLGWLKNGTLYIAGEGGVMANADSSFLFFGCTNLKKIELNGCFDTRNVTNMYKMFSLCSSLTSLNLSGFDTSNVTNMGGMFGSCRSLTSLNLSGFDTSNVTNMSGMFESCSSLTSLDVSGFDTGNITDMNEMFSLCSSLTSLNLSGFNTSKVTNMSGMFGSCRSLTSLNLSGFNTSKVTNMSGMFGFCSSLTSLNLSGFDTSKVTNISRMFDSCRSLISLDLSGFSTSKVTNMSKMFVGCSNLTSLDVSGFDTSNVINMNEMFKSCSSLVSLDLSGFDTSKVKEMNWMFHGCSSLTFLDLSGFDISNGTYTNWIFEGCRSDLKEKWQSQLKR